MATYSISTLKRRAKVAGFRIEQRQGTGFGLVNLETGDYVGRRSENHDLSIDDVESFLRDEYEARTGKKF
jgi:hypothetical protein